MILATVSSDPVLHKGVRASLDGHLGFDAAWDLSDRDANRLPGVSPEQQCIPIVDFADLQPAMPVARAVDGRRQIIVIAVKGKRAGRNCCSWEELLQVMHALLFADCVGPAWHDGGPGPRNLASPQRRGRTSMQKNKLARAFVVGDLLASPQRRGRTSMQKNKLARAFVVGDLLSRRQADLPGLHARHRRSARGTPQGELVAGSSSHG